MANDHKIEEQETKECTEKQKNVEEQVKVEENHGEELKNGDNQENGEALKRVEEENRIDKWKRKREQEQILKGDEKNSDRKVISQAMWEEFQMMREVLGTRLEFSSLLNCIVPHSPRQGKALYLDYLEKDVGRYVEMTEEGRRTFGEEEDVWQDY